MAFLQRAVVPWRLLLVAGALSLLVGLTLSRGLLAARPAVSSGAAADGSAHRGLASLPLAAQGPASAALGAGRPAYRVRSSRGALLANSPAQHVSARFDSSGVELGSGSIRFGLSPRAIGYGSSLTPIDPVSPRARANRVTYAHRGLGEWYVNGPLGIEQGFTIAHAPARSASGALTLQMGLSGDALTALSHDAQSVVLSHGSSSLRYGGLLATDAAGGKLRSRLALDHGTLAISVDTRGARYPLRIDPLIQQGGKLEGKEEEGPGNFGTSVALSADGNTALIGGPSDEVKGKEMLVGAAWVFTRSGSTWTQQGPKLRGPDREGEGQFGISVALSADGNTALIGGIEDMNGGIKFGAAWVFTRSGSKWTQQGKKLTGVSEETANGRFGRSVALSADGNTALIGAYEDAAKIGAAWVFTRSGSTWSQQGKKLTGIIDEKGEAQFGLSVALSADGNTALIGGPGDQGGKGTAMAGAAWVFTRSAGTWTQQGAKLAGGPEESAAGEFGTSVALSSDGSTALAGAPADGGAGAAWAFTRTGSSWNQQSPKLIPTGATGAATFGAGVALSNDGNTALIGGPTDEHGGQALAGGAWLFTRSGSTWSQQGSKLEGDGTESEFGLAVALSADGDTAVLGGPVDGTDTGAAWAFVNPPPAIATLSASAIGTSTATLNGTVNPGASVAAYFQYGTTTAYGASTSAQALGVLNGARGVSATIAGLAPGTTYHFRIVAENSGGTTVGADQTFTTATPAKPIVKPLGPRTTPKITNFTQSRRVWRESRRLASFARRRKVPTGTTFSFTLNEKATVSFAFKQQVTGRKVRGRCVARTRTNRRRHACRRTLVRSMAPFTGHTKKNRVSFYGYLSRGRKLPPGSYTLVITATSAGLRSAPKSLSFTIVR